MVAFVGDRLRNERDAHTGQNPRGSGVHAFLRAYHVKPLHVVCVLPENGHAARRCMLAPPHMVSVVFTPVLQVVRRQDEPRGVVGVHKRRHSLCHARHVMPVDRVLRGGGSSRKGSQSGLATRKQRRPACSESWRTYKC